MSEGCRLEVYLINLEQARMRLQRMDRLLRAAGITYHRIAAIDGAHLSAEALDQVVRVAPDPEFVPAQVGCFLSHRLAWEAIAHGTAEYGLVLEDDLVLAKNFAELLPRLLQAEGADIIRLEGWPGSVWTKPRVRNLGLGYALYRLDWDTCGTAAYLISRKCARRLAAVARHYTHPVDLMLFSRVSSLYEELKTFAVAPAACYQHAFWRGASEGADFLASSISPVFPPRRKQPKKGVGPRILAEIRRGARRLDLLLSGQRRLCIDLHPVGPLDPDKSDGG